MNKIEMGQVIIKKYTLLIFALYLGSFSSAQNQPINSNNVLQGVLYQRPVAYEGSPFLQNEWNIGQIEMLDGKIIENIKLRFNILSGELVFYNESLSRLFTADHNTINSFTLNHNIPVSRKQFEKYKGEEVGLYLVKNDFIHVLYKGNHCLFVKHSSTISVTNDRNSKDKIIPKDYYFIENNKKTSVIRLRLRTLRRMYPEHKKLIREIISEYKLRNRSIEDMVKLLEVYDEKVQSY